MISTAHRRTTIALSLVLALCIALDAAADPALTAKPDPEAPGVAASAGAAPAGESHPAHPIAPNVDLKEVTPALAPPAGDPDAMGPPLPHPEATPNFPLLGSEVAPATAARLAWSPDGSISGLASPTPVLVVNGHRPGRTLCLTAAVHGDELNGIEIVRRVLYDINPGKLSGRIVGIPIVNLDGFRRGSRYLSDRRDLNRHFPGSPDGSLAARIAHSLFAEILVHCDVLVDIHTGSLGRTNLPQVRADMRRPEAAEVTRGFGNIVVLHSPGSRNMLRRAALDQGIVAVTLEVGESRRLQDKPVAAGVLAINRLLQHQGMYSRLFRLGSPEPIYYESLWVRAPEGGILLNDIKLGAFVEKDSVLGAVVDPITNVRTPIQAPVNGRLIGMAVNQVVMPGFAAYHLGTEAPEEEPVEIDDLEPSPEEEVIDEAAADGEIDPEE